MLLLSKLIIISTLSSHLSYLYGTHFLRLINSLFLLPLSSTFSPIISILTHNNHYCNYTVYNILVIIINLNLFHLLFAIINIRIIVLFFSIIIIIICIISSYYSLTGLYHWGSPCISIFLLFGIPTCMAVCLH